MDKKDCAHEELECHSGGYYLQCVKCHALWVCKSEMSKENEWAGFEGQHMGHPYIWKKTLITR